MLCCRFELDENHTHTNFSKYFVKNVMKCYMDGRASPSSQAVYKYMPDMRTVGYISNVVTANENVFEFWKKNKIQNYSFHFHRRLHG